MTFDDCQIAAARTAIYPEDAKILYSAMGQDTLDRVEDPAEGR